MPIDPTDLANLKAASLSGRPPCAEYLKVTWDTGVINYYGTAAWNDEAPYTGIGHTIEARLIPKSRKDPFHGMEINPDLRTDSIKIVFDDIDKDITNKFQTYGSGVACEFFLYYPDQTLTVSVWSGRLQAPEVYGWKQVECVATNGHKSRELFLPRRGRPPECIFTFGGALPDAESIRSNGCPYDLHIGGSIGKFKTGSTPFSDCPKDRASCLARIDENSDNIPEMFGGFATDASAIISDHTRFYLAISRGNTSNLKEPIRWIFGTKNVKGLPILLWRREVNQNTPDRGFVSFVADVGEGPVSTIYNLKVNDRFVGQEHINFRLGGRGQVRTGYAPDVSNFSSTAVIFARYGWINAAETSPSDLNIECMVKGFSEVCVYTDDDPITKTRIYSDDRVWCLLELYKNQKAGMGYAESEIQIADWRTASTWGTTVVAFTATYGDGETRTFVGPRTTFNAILEGRPVQEQVADICRSGGLSVPFWHEGNLTISPFTAFTEDELDEAPVFYDKTSDVNITWENEPLIRLSQIKDDKLTNDIKIRFEEAANNGTEREITVDDRNQKLKAGRQLGAEVFLEVPKTYVGFGIDNLSEATRLGYRLLKFGEFDEGGTDNNLKLTLTVPFEQGLGIKRYSPIKVVSSLLDPFTLAKDTDFEETPEYFRVLSLKKVSGNRMEITAQAYNRTSYEAFEDAATVDPPASAPAGVAEAGEPIVNGLYTYVGHYNDKPAYEDGFKRIENDTGKWVLLVSGANYYETSNNTNFPWDATWVVGTQGLAPAPLVTQGVRFDGGGCKVTLDVPTYDTATGLIDIPIDPC